MKQFSLLLITILLPVVTFVPDAAMAVPMGCLDSQTLGAAIETGGTYMLFDPGDRSVNSDGPINIREEPTTRSRVRYIAASRNPVSILRQVTGDDGYCWLRVTVTTNQSTGASAVTVTGWVRGDLVRIGID